jgi:AsmA protein
MEPDSSLAGIIDFNGDITSDGRQLISKGRAKADRLQFVKGGAPAGQPVSLDYGIDYNLKNQSGTLSGTRVAFGNAIARLNGTYSMRGESTVLNMKLRGDNMPAEDLQSMLPAIGVTLPKGASIQGGTLNADLTAEGPVERTVTTGAIGIFKARLAGFDLGSKMTAVASLAGIKPDSGTEIEKFTSDVRVAPDGNQAKSLLLVVPALGELSGAGVVGADSSLDFKMLARLRPAAGLAGSLTRLAGGNADTSLSVPFSIRGTTSNPTYVPDTKAAAKNLLQSVISGKGSKPADGSQGQKLEDALRGLFKKKKP